MTPRSPSRAARRIAQGKRPATEDADDIDRETDAARARLLREDTAEIKKVKIP